MTDTTARDEQVRQIITTALDCDADSVVADAKLVEDLGADSLDSVEITMEMEDAFAVKISDTEAEKCKTVGDWTSLVAGKVDSTR